MLIDLNRYNGNIDNRRKAEQNAAGDFAQIAQLIEPGDCFFVAINAYADSNPYNIGQIDVKETMNIYPGSPVFLKFIQVIEVTNVGVECMVATVEGIIDNQKAELVISNISLNREIYPSFADVLYLKWEIYQFDGGIFSESHADYMYSALHNWEDIMRSQIYEDQGQNTKSLEGNTRGIKGNTEGDDESTSEGIEPTHFDVSIYTGNDVEISSQFANYKEHPADENPDDPENPEDSEPENTGDPEPEDPKGSGDQR